MRIPGALEEGTFLERPNRFAALVRVNGREARAHLPNSGRLRDLLEPGRRVWLRPAPPGRSTEFDLLLVALLSGLVSVDARLPPSLVHEALASGRLPRFQGWEVLREVTWGDSRLDLLLRDGDARHFIEVKSVTLVKDGRALFPDAVTRRGARHLRALAEARRRGLGAGVIFVVQREDATSFSPQDDVDPAFGLALREAMRAGVEADAYVCRVSHREIALDREIGVTL